MRHSLLTSSALSVWTMVMDEAAYVCCASSATKSVALRTDPTNACSVPG